MQMCGAAAADEAEDIQMSENRGLHHIRLSLQAKHEKKSH